MKSRHQKQESKEKKRKEVPRYLIITLQEKLITYGQAPKAIDAKRLW